MENEVNESNGSFDLYAEAEALTDEGTSNSDGESVADNSQGPAEESLESPDKILEALSKEQAPNTGDFKDVLEKINGLGFIHNGTAFTIDSSDKLKEYIQKGFDYTQKTMLHSDEVKRKTEEFTQRENEFKQRESAFIQREQQLNETLTTHQLLTSLIADLQANDPDTFSMLDEMYRRKEFEYQQQLPMLKQYEQKFQNLTQEINQIKGSKDKENLNLIKNSWDKDLSEVQSKVAPSIAKLGVKVDWDKVKTAWSADSTNTMSVEQALYSVYGKQIIEANQSYQKKLATKAKVQDSLLSRNGIGTQSKGMTETKVFKMGDYDAILRA